MSEHWKSTPKYHCKYCNTFVRDTRLEKANHEASLKHQGNIKRYLRDLHRGHEREEREKQRAKDEVERLNGVVSGSSSGSAPPWQKKKTTVPPPPQQQQATPAERKQQLAKLAELGVAIPEEFRGEMAMAGDWQVLSERVIGGEADGEGVEKKLNIGVRKRKLDDDGEEEEAERVGRKPWGSRIKTYPVAGDEGKDLDVLLKKSAAFKGKGRADQSGSHAEQKGDAAGAATPGGEKPTIKREDIESDTKLLVSPLDGSLNEGVAVKTEDPPLGGEIMFKKRKAKSIRQK